ncbi:MAG: D-cysteine desulfhydrase family protein, partial [Paracoccaceae bacterium]|nr:D-cysteine desulfhydrase family protein [Paracoccaceae bacterium]
VRNAMEYAAYDEGLLLDPVYTGRVLAGMIGLTKQGLIEHGQSVAFIHTGGLPAIFAYQRELI